MDLLAPINELYFSLQEQAEPFLFFVLAVGLGYLVASALGWALRKVLYRLNLDKRLRAADLHDSLGSVSIARLAGIILKWYVFILFLQIGLGMLTLGPLTDVLSTIVDWLPQLILAVVIIILGLILIDFITNRILELRSGYVRLVANLIKVILIVVVVFTAIQQLGIQTDLAQNIFLMLVGAVLVAGSLALGIGLGLSLKDELRPFVRGLRKKMK